MTGLMRNGIRTGTMVLMIFALGLVALAPLPSSAKTVWGTAVAEPATEPGFEGYCHDQLEISWDTAEMGGHGMSHVDFFLSLGVCHCACYADVVKFDDVPGAGVGEDGCDLGFVGLYECLGDPHYPEKGATVKFEHDESGCDPAASGTVFLDFYSVFGPGEPQAHIGALGIKAGTYIDEGAIIGVLPLCECGSPVESSSWGVVKALYR